MNDPTNEFCDQCCESVKSDAKICPHCSFERFPDSGKTKRKKWKRRCKWFIAYATLPAALTLIGMGIYGFMEKENPDDWLTLIRYCFFALVCLHFFTFHIVYDEDEKKGGDDGGGGGGGGE